MTRLASILLILLMPMLLFAEEVAAETAPAVEALPTDGMTPLQMTIASVISAILLWLLKLARGKLVANTEQNKLDATKSLIEQKEILLRRIGDTAARVAETWVEDNIPALVKDAMDGGGFDWKGHFRHGFSTVRQEVKQVFADEGIDILKVIGEERLAGMIKAALIKAIDHLPEKFKGFLPKELTAAISAKVADFVTAKTGDWIEDMIEKRSAA